MSHVVEIDGLSKSYGTFHAVRDLTLQVDSGEIVALLGPNGAGKTTTIRMLMGLLQPRSGTARVLGFDCFAERAEVKSLVGYLPDEPVFFDYLRGREVVRFVGGMQGLSAREIEDAAGPLVERLELASALDEFAMNYSAGMKKKLALTCALLHDPKLLILDEPTNGLDPLGSRNLMAMIRERAAEGCAVFYSTHLLDQAERICHRIAIMRDGQLAALGPMAEVRESLAPGGSLEDAFFEVAGSRAPVESSE